MSREFISGFLIGGGMTGFICGMYITYIGYKLTTYLANKEIEELLTN